MAYNNFITDSGTLTRFTDLTLYSSNGVIEIVSLTNGYTSGGFGEFPPGFFLGTTIDKFPFASDANATDVGDLSLARYGVAGQSSIASGYTSGGFGPSTASNVIDKFPFATNANATDVGVLTVARDNVVGQSSSDSGYASGGFGPSYSNVIDKFPFATNANATDVGDLTVTRSGAAGQSSNGYGYASGGLYPFASPSYSNVIDKFPFASDGNATDVGDLTVARYLGAGQSSSGYGYASGGPAPGSYTNIIDKFPFASNANATDVGDLTVTRRSSTGQSSTVSGYASGGFPPGGGSTYSNVIEKFPFASDANATDVGDLSLARYGAAGQQG